MSDSAPLENAPLDPAPPKGALGIIFLILFTDFLGFGIIIPLLAFYVPDYELNPLKVTLLFSVYSICQFIASPILGALSDRFGRRPILAISQFGSAAGYILLGLATTIHWSDPAWILRLVFLSRIIDGLSGGNVSTAQAYISDVTTPQNRAKGMGLLGAAFGIGFSAGPALGGILGHWSISLPGYVAAGFSALAAFLTLARLPESRIHKPLDVEAWLHPSQFSPVLRKPALVQFLLIGFVSMAAFVMMESTLALFLASPTTFHYSKLKVGLFYAFIGVVIAVVQGGLIGRLNKRMGEWPLAILGPLFVGLGMLGLIGVAWHPVVWLLLLAGTFNAAGRSLQQPSLSSLISKFASPREQGVTFGLYHGLSSLARVIGPIIAGLAYPLLRHTGPYITAGALVALVALWTLSLRAKHPTPPEPAAVAKSDSQADTTCSSSSATRLEIS